MKDSEAKKILDSLQKEHLRPCKYGHKLVPRNVCECIGCVERYHINTTTLERYLNNALNVKESPPRHQSEPPK